MKIGVLAVQGDFDAHKKTLETLGAEVVLVRKPEQLSEIDGLVIPGGESSAFLKLLGEQGFDSLGDFVRQKPTFGTCAGCILLAKEVSNPSQVGLGVLDVGVTRNAYGRQIDSTIIVRDTKLAGGPLEQVYIRAPRIDRVGTGVEVLAERDGHAVLVRQGRIMAATFHPELSDDTRVHEEFLKLVTSSRR
jgi:pyridoxal 5'-phosphate synthase pdxT subunit